MRPLISKHISCKLHIDIKTKVYAQNLSPIGSDLKPEIILVTYTPSSKRTTKAPFGIAYAKTASPVKLKPVKVENLASPSF
jgi:hypothetical protein